MEPIRVKELPIEYSIDKDLLRLISEANAKYGEYKACLKNMDFDPNPSPIGRGVLKLLLLLMVLLNFLATSYR